MAEPEESTVKEATPKVAVPGERFANDLLQCQYCQQEFTRDQQYLHTSHTPQEWEDWRVAQGIPDDAPYLRQKALGLSPPPPDPPGDVVQYAPGTPVADAPKP